VDGLIEAASMLIPDANPRSQPRADARTLAHWRNIT
jgi:hypothetical protein